MCSSAALRVAAALVGCFLLCPSLVCAHAQSPDIVRANAEATDAFQDSEWATPPGLLEVDLRNFETTVQNHELSVMVFFTKFSPRYHRYAQRVLSNVSLGFQRRSDGPSVAFCSVDLDKTPELSTYTHFNSIDVMYFYPHLIMNGVRYPGNLTEESVLNFTNHMYQHTTAHLLKLNEPFSDAQMKQLVTYYANPNPSASSSGDGVQHAIQSAEMHLRHQKDLLDALVQISEDSGVLAKESNRHVQSVLRFGGRELKTTKFLESRRLTELYANFLEHLYDRKKVPQNKQATPAMHSAEAGKVKQEAEEEPSEDEDLM